MLVRDEADAFEQVAGFRFTDFTLSTPEGPERIIGGVVTPGWLERMAFCLSSDQNIATATPWSNNAEICSLPKTLQANPIPADIDHLARELYAHHQPVYPQLPTAVGFAMLVSQQAKARVGYFDEETFGHGYGEENDYSLRLPT